MGARKESVNSGLGLWGFGNFGHNIIGLRSRESRGLLGLTAIARGDWRASLSP